MKLNSVERNAMETVQRTCKVANIKVTKSALKDKLLQHPTFPSMQSLRDTFSSLNVPNLAVRIEPILLDKVATPLIVYLNGGLGYAIVENVKSDFVECFHNDIGKFREHRAEFSRKWQGVSLVIEPNKLSGDKDYAKNRGNEIRGNLKLIFGLITAAFFLTTCMSSDPKTGSWLYNSLIFIHVAGIIISILLIRISMNKYENFWRKGSELNFPTSSERVLRSELAKIIPGFTWSEISLIYFTGGLFSSFTSKSVENAAGMLLIFNYGALLFTFWLFHVQIKLRSACWGCIAISILLLIELSLLTHIGAQPSQTWNEAKQLIMPFLLPVVLWLFIKRPVESVSLAEGHYYKIRRMMFDPVNVRAILTERKNIPPFFNGMNKIILGDTAANNCITLVLNPICYMCWDALQKIQKLISESPDFKCEIFFAVSSNYESIDHRLASAILGSLDGNEAEVLIDWYQSMPMKFEDWVETRKPDQVKGSVQLTHHLRWFDLAGLHSELPITLLNGAELPAMYNASDIKKLLRISNNNDLVRK